MDEKVKSINEFFKYLTQNNDTKEYETFFALLEQIKYNSNLLEYYGEEFVEHMIELLPHIEDKYDRASLIETIIECSDIYTVSEKFLKEIFDEYALCLAEKAVNVKGMSACLMGFIQAGISEKEVIKKLEENLEKEYVISVLSKMYINYLANSVESNSSLLKEAQEAYYLSQRSGIIAQFLLLVNPHIRKYAGISQITFLYESYRGVYEDCWPRGLLPNMKDTLIKSKVLSSKEVSILEELDRLINTQGENLDSMEVRKLYDDFFENKDPFEVIFTLPV
ncbi:hypothetical protein HP398_13225 [Brevibacillus sp. HB1.4B]|uniref:hypothetical protein n=1 Tax=Brevibacillus sp. HB1.4B TaxID=2738845 RepID=UPI00037FBD56|nr:hypothetical protein A616_05880 [Brevibacillus brevis X23]NRS17394.1 hypothetical protein [Brevibacillus sp. HB1.4B]